MRRCHYCNFDPHLVRDCDQAKKDKNTQEKRPSFQKLRVNQIQVIPTEEVNEETEVKVVMQCEVNLTPSHQEPEQMILKQSIMKDDNNALKKIQLNHVDLVVEIRGKETDKFPAMKVNALSDLGAEIPVISEELIERMNLEQVGEVSLQCIAGEAIPAKLIKVDVRLYETPSDTDEEIRANKGKFTMTPYVTLVCACIAKMERTKKFLLHPEIIADLKAIPQVTIEHEEEVQANVITRAQKLREEALAADSEEEKEYEENSEKENESDKQGDGEASITSDRNRQENNACESDNLLEYEDSDEGVRNAY